MEVKKDVKETKKRPVGRPPKVDKNEKKSIMRKGVIPKPQNSAHVIELVYDTPTTIKRIFNLFKLMDTQDIRIEFKLSSVNISSAGRISQNFVSIDIDSTKLTQYYCKHNIIVNLDSKNLEKVVQKIDKSYDSIYIIATEDSYKKSINIILNDETLGVQEFHRISLIEGTNNMDMMADQITYQQYPLNFTLSSKYFKKIVSDVARFSKDFTIEKRPNVLLSFPYDSSSKTVDCETIITNKELFQINSSMEPNDMLSVTVRIEYIQSIASALVAENLKIYVHPEDMLYICTEIDGGLFKLVLAVKIVSYRS
jgi:hypothetical protein